MEPETYQFKTMLGEPIPEWANKFLNERVEPEHRKEFDRLVHEVERYFENWNREVCVLCGTTDDHPAIKWGYGGAPNNGFKYGHGCCTSCVWSNGYFEGATKQSVTDVFKPRCGFDGRLPKGYDTNPIGHGFFNEGLGGCSLPRHIRSRVCLRFCCEYDMIDTVTPLVDRICSLRGFK